MLIQAIFKRNQDNKRFILLAPHPSTALPGCHNGTRISDQDTDIQIANIYSQFQRAGGYDAKQRPI